MKADSAHLPLVERDEQTEAAGVQSKTSTTRGFELGASILVDFSSPSVAPTQSTIVDGTNLIDPKP